MMQLFNLLNLLLNSNQEAFARCLYVRVSPNVITRSKLTN